MRKQRFKWKVCRDKHLFFICLIETKKKNLLADIDAIVEFFSNYLREEKVKQMTQVLQHLRDIIDAYELATFSILSFIFNSVIHFQFCHSFFNSVIHFQFCHSSSNKNFKQTKKKKRIIYFFSLWK